MIVNMKIPEKDFEFMETQTATVMKLWLQCWRVDPYGSRWMPLNHSLKTTSFRIARKVLSEAGLFVFRRVGLFENGKEIASWEVLNLHGSKTAKRNNYWMKYIEDSESNQDLGETDQAS